jgi:lysyl-tRNA synthetase class 1
VLEKLNHPYDPGAVARATEIALEVEAEAGDRLRDCTEPLYKRSNEEEATNDHVAKLLWADATVCSFQLMANAAKRSGGPLGAKATFDDGSVWPPLVTEFPETLVGYFEARAAQTTRADLRARYNDFLWLRRSSFPNARAALDAYTAAGSGGNFGDTGVAIAAINYLRRAAELSLSLNLEVARTAAAVLAEMNRALTVEAPHLPHLTDGNTARLIALDPNAAAALFGAVMAQGAAREVRNMLIARQFYGAAEQIATAIGDRGSVQAARLALARTFETEAAGGEPMTELHAIGQAIEAYERVDGSGEVLQRLKNQYADAAVHVAHELPTHKFSVPFPAKAVEDGIVRTREFLGKQSHGLLWLPKVFGLIPEWSQVRSQFAGVRKVAPLQFLLGRTAVTKDGRLTVSPHDEAEREDALVLEHYVQSQGISAALSFPVIDALRESGEWSADALITALGAVDPEMADACASGIRAFEAGDYWTACHVLTPQVERELRKLALATSANVRRLVSDQGIEVASLNSLLEDETFVRVLGDDLTRCLSALLTDPRGLNLRNRVAHGLLEPDYDHHAEGFIALMCVLLSTWLVLLFTEQQAKAQAPAADPRVPAAANGDLADGTLVAGPTESPDEPSQS